MLPYIYESDQLVEWENRFFWGVRRRRTRKAQLSNEVLFDDSHQDQEQRRPKEEDFEEVKPLAEELIDTLIDLLFFADFTLPRPANSRSKVTYAIWQSGVGCNTAVGTSKEFENNRAEILRLLLTLTSKSMYLGANVLPVLGVRAITYIATCADKQVVLSVLCSLLNTALKYNPVSWRVPYNPVISKDSKQVLVTYALQFLLVILVYPIPESGKAQKNYYRHFLGRLHRPQDFQFIVEGMTRVLNQPMQASASYIPGAQASTKCVPEMIMLFWEITQCNKRFRSFIIDTDRSHDFVILLLFYIQEYKLDPAKQGVVRMCVFLLQTLSVEPNFGPSLNKRFEAQDTLPPSIRVAGFYGSYADYLIHSIYTIITTSQGKLTAVYPALLAIINNVAAYVENLSAAASSKLLQLFTSMSSPSFLLANESNHDLLRALLDATNSIIEHRYEKNPNLIYAILRNQKRFEALRTFTLESGQEEIARRERRRKEEATSSSHSDRRSSNGSARSPSGSHVGRSTLGGVPEEGGTFAIGDDDDDTDDDHRPTPAYSTPSDHHASRASSVCSPVDDAVPVQLRGLSEKARGKMPAGAMTFSRQNSTTSLGSYGHGAISTSGQFEPSTEWIESWLPELPLHTILTLIQELSPLTSDTTTPSAGAPTSILQQIASQPLHGIDPSPIRIHSFEWSPLSLGWYESLLWAFVFSSEIQVAKGTAGVWNGTHIKLFRVQEMAAEGPSLTSPRGAVDAVGSNIVSRIGNINLRAASLGSVGSNAQSEGGGNRT